MKIGSKELDEAISKKQPVYFDTQVQYDPLYDDYKEQTFSQWPYLAKATLY